MIVPVEIPDNLAKQFRLNEEFGSGELLKAFVLQRYIEGTLTAGQVKEALALSFQETEQFLHDHSAPGLSAEEHLQGLRNLQRGEVR